MNLPEPKSVRPPLTLLLAAMIVYLGLFGLFLRTPGNAVKSDSLGYLQLSDNLRHHHVFSSAPSAPFTPEVFRLPGYPLFLAALGATSPGSITAAIAIQCLLGLALIFIVWPVFFHLGGYRGALAGTIFLCFDLVSLSHQNLIMTEALFVFTLSVASCGAIFYLESPSAKRAAAAGLLLGLAALIKPIALFVMGIFLLCSIRNGKTFIVLAVLTLSFPCLWVVRNKAVTGKTVYTIQAGAALLEYPAASALALDTGGTRVRALEALENEIRATGLDPVRDTVAWSHAAEEKAVLTMKQHPLATLRFCLTGTIRILGGTGLEMLLEQAGLHPANSLGSDVQAMGTGTLRILKMYPALTAVFIVYVLFLSAGYLLFLKGVIQMLGRGDWRSAVFVLLSVLIVLAVSCHQGYYRFRIPLLPFLALGIAAAFAGKFPSATADREFHG